MYFFMPNVQAQGQAEFTALSFELPVVWQQ